MPLFPMLRRQRCVDHVILDQPGLHNEVQARQYYIMRKTKIWTCTASFYFLSISVHVNTFSLWRISRCPLLLCCFYALRKCGSTAFSASTHLIPILPYRGHARPLVAVTTPLTWKCCCGLCICSMFYHCVPAGPSQHCSWRGILNHAPVLLPTFPGLSLNKSSPDRVHRVQSSSAVVPFAYCTPSFISFLYLTFLNLYLKTIFVRR